VNSLIIELRGNNIVCGLLEVFDILILRQVITVENNKFEKFPFLASKLKY